MPSAAARITILSKLVSPSRSFPFHRFPSLRPLVRSKSLHAIGRWVIPCVFVIGCGHPHYRLDGRVPGGVSEVGLLDGGAPALVDSLRSSHQQALQDLERWVQAARDSLTADQTAAGEPLAGARAKYESARQRYRSAFERMMRFRSFGGNPIFTGADRDVGTSTLLDEIADRFYRGRAFSLETEGEMRRYIRDRLVGLEQNVERARSAVARLQKAGKGRARAREAVESDYARRRMEAVERGNRELLSALEKRRIHWTAPDSAGAYLFPRLPAGRYCVYVPEPLPQAWLIPVDLQGHTRQDLADANLSVLLASEGE